MVASMNTPLDAEVKRLLDARKGDWKRIAETCDVSYSWISKFMNGHIPNPGYAKLRNLHEALSAEPA